MTNFYTSQGNKLFKKNGCGTERFVSHITYYICTKRDYGTGRVYEINVSAYGYLIFVIDKRSKYCYNNPAPINLVNLIPKELPVIYLLSLVKGIRFVNHYLSEKEKDMCKDFHSKLCEIFYNTKKGAEENKYILKIDDMKFDINIIE